MSDTDFKTELERLETWLRAGRAADVRTDLKLRNRAQPPREFLASYANVARRAGLPELSLRLLKPVVHPLDRTVSPSLTELAIYSASLGAIGAAQEAATLLTPHQNANSPDVQLYLGFAFIHRWEYEKAAPCFKRYLELDGTTPYQKSVAQLNLAACYTFLEDHQSLRPLINELLSTSLTHDWHLITRDAHLLAAQSYIQTSEWQAATLNLQTALSLSTARGLDTFLLQKWHVILRMHQERGSRSLKKAISGLRERCREEKRFEALRDCDYYEGLLTAEHAKLRSVFFGTPFDSYHQRVLKAARGLVDLPQSLRYRLHAKQGTILDLAGHDLSGIGLTVVRALAADLYKPLKIGGLFAAIYPGEYFDPASSPGRVRTALSRARESIAAAGFPVQIVCEDAEYFLSAESPCDLKLHRSYENVEPVIKTFDDELKKLKAEWPYKAFTSGQAANVLEISVARARKLLSVAAEEHEVFASGDRRSKVYRFAK